MIERPSLVRAFMAGARRRTREKESGRFLKKAAQKLF
jgi:hypothetical protein